MPKNDSKNKSDKRKIKINKKNVIITFFIMAFAIFAGNKVLKLILNPNDVVVIEKGTIEKIDTVSAYVARNEKVIKGENYKNGIVQIKSEGEKVAKGEQVFRYYTNNEEEVINKIEELDLQYQKALDGQSNFFSSDIKILDKKINSLIESISDTNNLNEIAEYKKQLNNTINKKAKIIGEQSPSGSYIKDLLEEKEKYEKKLSSESEYVETDISGTVSYKIDGYEDLFDINDLSKISEEQLKKIEMKTGQLIGTSQEYGKIVDNFYCYIIAVIDSEEARNAKEGDVVKIRLANTQETKAKVKAVNNASGNAKLIVFEIKSGVEYLTNYRKISVDIIWWTSTGLKVPNNSIIKEDNKNFVIRNRAGYTDKIPVKILKENEKFCLVDNFSTEELKKMGYSSEEIKTLPRINLYDEILFKPKT